jgi:hypothetical protein
MSRPRRPLGSMPLTACSMIFSGRRCGQGRAEARGPGRGQRDLCAGHRAGRCPFPGDARAMRGLARRAGPASRVPGGQYPQCWRCSCCDDCCGCCLPAAELDWQRRLFHGCCTPGRQSCAAGQRSASALAAAASRLSECCCLLPLPLPLPALHRRLPRRCQPASGRPGCRACRRSGRPCACCGGAPATYPHVLLPPPPAAGAAGPHLLQLVKGLDLPRAGPRVDVPEVRLGAGLLAGHLHLVRVDHHHERAHVHGRAVGGDVLAPARRAAAACAVGGGSAAARRAAALRGIARAEGPAPRPARPLRGRHGALGPT